MRPALRLNLGSVIVQSETGSVHSAGETGERRTVSAGQTYTASQSNAAPEPQSRLTGVTCSGGTLVYKKSMTLAPAVQTDGDVQYTLTYSSSNPKIAEVDRNGSITTRKSGTVTVTVTATNNADPADTVETTCTVTVKYAWWQWIIRILLLGFIWY